MEMTIQTWHKEAPFSAVLVGKLRVGTEEDGTQILSPSSNFTSESNHFDYSLYLCQAVPDFQKFFTDSLSVKNVWKSGTA